jgi:hypothetical protein
MQGLIEECSAIRRPTITGHLILGILLLETVVIREFLARFDIRSCKPNQPRNAINIQHTCVEAGRTGMILHHTTPPVTSSQQSKQLHTPIQFSEKQRLVLASSTSSGRWDDWQIAFQMSSMKYPSSVNTRTHANIPDAMTSHFTAHNAQPNQAGRGVPPNARGY